MGRSIARHDFPDRRSHRVKNSTARRLRQIPEGYLIVGVDPHKKSHVAVMMSQDAVVRKKLRFGNSRGSFEGMLGQVKVEASKAGCDGVVFAIEAGSHYWRNLAYFLDKEEALFRLVSPFTLKRRREGEDINRRKNDFRDAEMAAELLRTGKFTESRLPYGNYAEIRAAFGSYRRLRKESTGYVNVLKSLLDGVFPEFTEVFRDPRGKTALAVLSTCAIPGAIARLPVTLFMGSVRARFSGRVLKLEKLRELHAVAGSSIGVTEGAQAVSSEIALIIERIRLNATQMQEVTRRLVHLVDVVPESRHMLSIPGLGYLSVAGILAGLGPFDQFKSGRQLVKMAGTNPTQRESAGKASQHTPMSKQGRAGLRWCLWPAVVSLLHYNNDFKSWAKDRQERPAYAHPLHRREVIGAAVNRLLRLVFALVKKHACYQLPQNQISLAT
jgi:transposase